jgi:catechol 2,3-dioxygenase-like lactoylglutathione lyase family enzyme
MDGAIEFWTQVMGVGPFFRTERIVLEDLRYKGEPTDIDFQTAIAYWNDLQIELIAQRNDAPSIYRDSLEAGEAGLQHVCIVVDDLDHARALCEKAGAAVVQEGRIPGGMGRFLYADTGGGPGTMVELLEASPAMLQAFAAMREAARKGRS